MRSTEPIVAGVDGSEEALHALRWAIARAVRLGCGLRIVHAFPWPLVRTSNKAHGAPVNAWLHAEAQRIVDEARALVPPGTDVDAEVRVGFALPILLEEAEKAESVLLGSRGLGGVGALLVGSTGVELAARALCPVIVLPYDGDSTRDRPDKVVIGDDGSANARPAVEFGLREAHELGVPATIVEALRHGDDPADATTRAVPDAAGVQRLTPYGHPAEELIDAAGTDGMIVVGSRGRGGFRGLLLGSTSQAVLHHARCAVAVVRSPAKPAGLGGIDTNREEY